MLVFDDPLAMTRDDPYPDEPRWRTMGMVGSVVLIVVHKITLRLDADVVNWFKMHAAGGRGYQTDINRALREHVYRSEQQRVDV